jgi:hypothetical protein
MTVAIGICEMLTWKVNTKTWWLKGFLESGMLSEGHIAWQYNSLVNQTEKFQLKVEK